MAESVIYQGPERYERQSLPSDPWTVTLDAIIDAYGVRTACDLGCGLGCDVAMMQAAGLDVFGLDGSEALREHLLYDGPYLVADLREPLELFSPVDLIWCREVAEHLPRQFSERLVANIVANCRVCYFTAAPPGQVGSGHINCRPRQFWVELFDLYGFTVDEELTAINAENPNQDDRINGMVLS